MTLPGAVLGSATHVVRPRDLGQAYGNPTKEATRLVRQGALRRIATGYYLVPPPDRIGNPDWRPAVEDLALALATTDYPQNDVALMGVSAARLLGGLPRAISLAVIAVPRQRPRLSTSFGTVVFVKRDVSQLDRTRAPTRLAPGYMTDVDQTVLDLAARPDLGDLQPREIGAVLLALANKVDWTHARELAIRQHRGTAYMRARWACAPAMDRAVSALPTRRRFDGRGLRAFLPGDDEFDVEVHASHAE
ncbi:MAG TPA: type IV toxin-antitoxin system AbiEi family antitoxin domain-containing protein [Acidothermaceae bacterium]